MAGEDRWDCSNFSATRRVVTSDLDTVVSKYEGNKNEQMDKPIVTSDYYCACTCPFALLNEVCFSEPFSLICSLELFSEFIISHTSGVYN